MHLQKILWTVAVAVLASTASAEIIIEHLGDNHPEANGWALSHGNNATAYPIQNDLGYIDSWRIASGLNGELSYFRSLTPTQHNHADTLGWALTCIARIQTCDTSGAIVQFGTGTKVFGIDICPLHVGHGLSSGYHLYRLVSPGAGGEVKLYIDGTLVESGIQGTPTTGYGYVEWGDVVGSVTANADAYYALVRFEVDPDDKLGGCKEPVVDCNGNGVLDPCESYIPSLDDCNGNSVLDACEIGVDTSLDCNLNLIPDECDLTCNGIFSDYVVVAPHTPPGHNNPNTRPVFVYSLNGTDEFFPRQNLPDGQVLDPAGVVFDSYGELFVGNRDGNSGPGSISRFKFDGCGNWRFNGLITGNGLEAVHQVAISPLTGELFAVNYWSGTVSRFKFDWRRNAVANGIVQTNGLYAQGVAVSPSGDLFVAASDGAHRFLIDANGDAVFKDTLPGIGAIMHFTPQGELLLGGGTICSFDEAGLPTCEPVDGVQGGAAMILTPSNELLVSYHGTGGINRYILTGPRSAAPNGSIPTASLFDLAILDLSKIPSRDCNGNLMPDECDLSEHVSFDCNQNAVPDECENPPAFRIVSTDPPNGAIDARQDRSVTGQTPQGFDRIRLTFSCPPFDAQSLQPPEPGSFSLSTSGGLTPLVLAVVPDESAETTYDIILSDPIPAGEWTTFSADVRSSDGFILDQLANRLTLGLLPGDVNANRTSTPSDILDLIDNLNHVRVPALAKWQCDIDRSSVCAPADILRLVDLLNGANTSRSWLGVGLPEEP